MRHRWTVRTALLASLLAAGCSPTQHASEPEATSAPTSVAAREERDHASEPEVTPASTPTLSAEEREAARVAEDKAAILDVHQRYRDAVAAVQAGNVDPALFDGIATAAAAEQQLAIGRNYQAWGITVEGKVILSRVDVEIAAAPWRATEVDTATVWACADHSAMEVQSSRDVPPYPDDVVEAGIKFQRIDGAWLVVGDPDTRPNFTC
jgi:hypothetical protein